VNQLPLEKTEQDVEKGFEGFFGKCCSMHNADDPAIWDHFNVFWKAISQDHNSDFIKSVLIGYMVDLVGRYKNTDKLELVNYWCISGKVSSFYDTGKTVFELNKQEMD
jgi:hypothetical protein